MEVNELNKVQKQLSDFVGEFVHSLGRCERRHWCQFYLAGLLLDGERKSIEPICDRLDGGNVQALRQFVNQSPWDHTQLMSDLCFYMLNKNNLSAGTLVLDDFSLPKKGKHSVGVVHQYCGALGKTSNCQVVVSWQYVGKELHFPLSARLYLPKEWTTDVARMDEVHIPEEYRSFKEKWLIALDLLDSMKDMVPINALTFDAGYGVNRKFLAELDNRNFSFVGQITNDQTFWDGEVNVDFSPTHKSGRGGPRKYPHVSDQRLRPKSAKEWGAILFSENTNLLTADLPLQSGGKATFVAKRVYETKKSQSFAVGKQRWLIIERLSDNSYKYYVSNFDQDIAAETILLIARERWKVEQGYQQLKEELGLDHFEGRSWRGLHHHIALTFMAYDFLQLLRLNIKKNENRNDSSASSAVY